MYDDKELVKYQIDQNEKVVVVEGAISAGLPAESDVNEQVSLVSSIFGATGPVALVSVRGDSMIGSNIFDGDTAVIDKGRLVNDGDLVAVRYEGGYTLKYINIDHTHRCTRLIPDNRDYQPMQFEEGNEPEILGVCIVTFSFKHHLTDKRRDEILRESPNIVHFGRESRRDRINRAVEYLLKLDYSDGRPLMRYAKDWSFVFRILAEEGDFGPSDYLAFVRYLNGLPSVQDCALKLPTNNIICKQSALLIGRYPAWRCASEMKLQEFERGCKIAEHFANAL